MIVWFYNKYLVHVLIEFATLPSLIFLLETADVDACKCGKCLIPHIITLLRLRCGGFLTVKLIEISK